MGNIIYITGAPRCGKTTLAKNLTDENTSLLSLDALSKSLRSVFSDFKLYSGKVCIKPDINEGRFLEFVNKYVYSFFNDYPNQTLIIEGCHFTPDEFRMKFPESKIICLGRTKSENDIIKAIMTKNWMAELNENTISEYARQIYNYSRKLRSSNYLYFETDEIDLNYIKNNLFCD